MAAVAVATAPAVAAAVDPRAAVRAVGEIAVVGPTAVRAVGEIAVVGPTAVEVARAAPARIAVVDPIVAAVVAASIHSVVTPVARQQPSPHEPYDHCEYAARYTGLPV